MLKNPYSTRPNEVKSGDVFVYVVKAMITYEGDVRLYRCPWNAQEEPQGARMTDRAAGRITPDIFPVLGGAPMFDDQFTCNYTREHGVFYASCGAEFFEDDDNGIHEWIFCPHCGRRIRGNEE